MRVLLTLSVVLAGCLGSPPTHDGDMTEECAPTDVTWYLHEGRLVREAPPQGSTNGNGFAEGFLNNDLAQWLSLPLESGVVIEGNVSLQLWVRYNGAPAPLAIGGTPGEGYHFFNQFGSDVTFQPSYAIEYAPVAIAPDTVIIYNETFVMPEGGFVVEKGHAVRLLLTGLLLESDPLATEILTGGAHASRLTYRATCFADEPWVPVQYLQHPVLLPGNQGLLTGAIPATEGVNQVTYRFTLLDDTNRLTVRVRQEQANHPGKDDVDMEFLNEAGNVIYTQGSPFTDETLVLWDANLHAFAPTGQTYLVRIHSYSGVHYVGNLEVLMERAGAGHAH